MSECLFPEGSNPSTQSPWEWGFEYLAEVFVHLGEGFVHLGEKGLSTLGGGFEYLGEGGLSLQVP